MRLTLLACVGVAACLVGVAGSPQRDGRVVYLDQHLYPSLLYINMAAGSTKVNPGGKTGNSDIIQLFLSPVSDGPPEPKVAVVVLGGGTPSGILTLTQNKPPVGPTTIEGTISDLTPGYHGFHIHKLGSLKNGCVSAAGHYNPYKQPHGSPDKIYRHVGDLGNIVADQFGVAQVNISDPLVSLVGPRSVVGRAIVVHAGEDDLGEGGDEGSLSTGNAGGRVACGVIGHA